MEQITLCDSCYRDYVAAGYNLERDYSEPDMDYCDKCCKVKMGWTYIIERE